MESSSTGALYQVRTKPLREEALEHLASIDLIELCKEAKVEKCRAARDVSSCGRPVQHVLKSCGHASLCAECSQRCDLCPVCRIPIPNNGSRVRLRLYNECIEAGLIPKRYDDLFQEKDGRKQSTDDIQRLYSLFDVAIENNLVSLVCHYVTDVCMDESAVSSDPVLAFLLDEVVVKDWCKRTFENVIANLRQLYTLRVEEMKTKLDLLLKYISQLNGISCVLDVLESSFKGALSPQLHDLHDLSENLSKVMQHLEVMAWCVRHQFLENIQSRYSNAALWRSIVRERKLSATKRSWSSSSGSSVEPAGQDGSTLFIEDALSNLGIDEVISEVMGEEIAIRCLEKGGSYPSLFNSKIEGATICYPFENLRAATDILFLRGSSDMVVAKQAIFLYYLFDRHWTVSDTDWRRVIDDFASTFGISRHSLLESLTFCLLDDETEQALEEACHLLPEIAGTTTHPKIAQVLLERQKPDAALMVLRCSGRDGLCGYANAENGGSELVSLDEVVTAVRVRVECGLLTEAFMYQRMYCERLKKEKVKRGSASDFLDGLKYGCNNGMEHLEVLVTEICCLCLRRNLIDHMIELPWNSDEEKYLHKCLFENAVEDPSTSSGSLLVVFYLQRYRYIEAYQVDRKLQSLEEDIISKTLNEEIVLRIRATGQRRAGLVDKCIELLPEAQKQQVKNGNFPDIGFYSAVEVQSPAKADLSVAQSNSSSLPAVTSINSSIVLGMDLTLPSKTTSASDNLKIPRSGYGEYQASVPYGRLVASVGSPSTPHQIGWSSVKGFAHNPHFRDNLASNSLSARERRHQTGIRHDLLSDSVPVTQGGHHVGLQSTLKTQLDNHFIHVENVISGMEPNGSLNQVQNAHPSMHRPGAKDHVNEMATLSNNNVVSRYLIHDSNPAAGKQISSDRAADDTMGYSWSFGKRDSPAKHSNINSVPRWRSDETSEDEEDSLSNRIMGGASASPAMRTRRNRLRRR